MHGRIKGQQECLTGQFQSKGVLEKIHRACGRELTEVEKNQGLNLKYEMNHSIIKKTCEGKHA